MPRSVLPFFFALFFLATASVSFSADWQPAGENIKTRWAKQITPENVWKEYPRPQMVRKEWTNLNGLWDYTVRKATDAPSKSRVSGKILVPFCLESSLSGVQRRLTPTEELVYFRKVRLKKKPNKRYLLHFEAVDYECDVRVNSILVGKHTGGNTPFSFDITHAIKDELNSFQVRVKDKTEGTQLRGKQRLREHGIFYTRVSGIWQTVWLEEVPPVYISRLEIDTAINPAEIRLAAKVMTNAEQYTLRVKAFLDKKEVAAATCPSGEQVTLPIPDAKLWSPDSPTLYDLTIELLQNGQLVDSVSSYAGIRTVGKQKDKEGHWRLTLNDTSVFHLGILDQGWWPDGLLTPPTDAALLWDLEYLKNAGFNVMRPHVKVQPRRYYYHCDKLGLMVWQDLPTSSVNPPWTRLAPNPKDATFTDEQHKQFMFELQGMVDALRNHPSVVMWVPFNEAWGQHRTMKVGKWLTEYDKTRLLNIASGGNFAPVGDVADNHNYPLPDFPLDDVRFKDYVKVAGEFGAHPFVPDEKHLWKTEDRRGWRPGMANNRDVWWARYTKSIERLSELKRKGLAGAIYTQASDVERGYNGMFTYDREIAKFEPKRLAAIHKKVLTSGGE